MPYIQALFYFKPIQRDFYQYAKFCFLQDSVAFSLAFTFMMVGQKRCFICMSLKQAFGMLIMDILETKMHISSREYGIIYFFTFLIIHTDETHLSLPYVLFVTVLVFLNFSIITLTVDVKLYTRKVNIVFSFPKKDHYEVIS